MSLPYDIRELTKLLNAAGHQWAMINYPDGTFWAVVRKNGEYIGDDLSLNFDADSYLTPEAALQAAAKDVLAVQA